MTKIGWLLAGGLFAAGLLLVAFGLDALSTALSILLGIIGILVAVQLARKAEGLSQKQHEENPASQHATVTALAGILQTIQSSAAAQTPYGSPFIHVFLPPNTQASPPPRRHTRCAREQRICCSSGRGDHGILGPSGTDRTADSHRSPSHAPRVVAAHSPR